MKENLSPGCKFLLSKTPESLVTVCGTESLFTQVTVSPTFTETELGLKEKLEILTWELDEEGVADSDEVGTVVGFILLGLEFCDPLKNTTKSTTTTKTAPAIIKFLNINYLASLQAVYDK